jgi:hypothetical protein
MYLVSMDQRVQSDIAAAAAAHHELGRDYDDAVAESLVERIGSEIDRRVDAKFAARDQGRRRSADVTPTDRRNTLWLGIGIGSGVTGVTAAIASAAIGGHIDNILGQMASRIPGGSGDPSTYDVAGDTLAWVVGLWGLLVVTYVLYTWVRHVRGRE